MPPPAGAFFTGIATNYSLAPVIEASTTANSTEAINATAPGSSSTATPGSTNATSAGVGAVPPAQPGSSSANTTAGNSTANATAGNAMASTNAGNGTTGHAVGNSAWRLESVGTVLAMLLAAGLLAI